LPVSTKQRSLYPPCFSNGDIKSDSVKDRLAAYYHWGDRQCLEQAIMVAKDQDINLEEVRRWSKKEGKQKDFEVIAPRLNVKKRK
jgi:hypothetical protein